MAYKVHVVSKDDVSNHTVIAVHDPLPPLAAPRSVRVRTKLTTLTRNNITYAATSRTLPFIHAYPVSENFPAPYNDAGNWGIVPCWGYSEVLESTIDDIAPGTTLYGYWPTSSLPVDLQLESAGPAGHYWDVSEHKKVLWSLYKHIEVVEDLPPRDAQAITVGFMPLFGASYYLDRYCFPVRNSGFLAPPMSGQQWSAEDGDLDGTVVVNLCASSKTARAFSWLLRRRDPGSRPLAVLDVSSSPESLPAPSNADGLETKSVSYHDLTDEATVRWISDLKASRVVVVDFGAPANVVHDFEKALFASPDAPPALLCLAVGGSFGVELKDARSRTANFNTTDVKDYARERGGSRLPLLLRNDPLPTGQRIRPSRTPKLSGRRG